MFHFLKPFSVLTARHDSKPTTVMSLSMEQTVVLTEDGHLELTPISQNCVLHAVEVLAPTQATSLLLPSGAYKIEQFSKSLVDVIKHKAPRKRTDTLSLADDSLLPSIDISKFYEGAMSTTDFAKKIENKLVDLSQGSFDVDSLHRACWKVYDFDKKSAISHPKWLSPECTYRLWLIYNCVLEKNTGTTIRIRTANEVLKRIVELCGYTWNGSYQMSDKTTLDFPEYLDSITRYFTYLKLETSLTCEVILDMVDEIVHGVLRKGYLIKKGHKRKNWKKRWFVLQRTVLKYFESMEKPIFKVWGRVCVCVCVREGGEGREGGREGVIYDRVNCCLCMYCRVLCIQWNLRIKDTWGPEQVSFIQRCPLFGG